MHQNILDIIEKFTEIELKFRIAKCMVENHQFKEACALLQPLPAKQRSAKINMLLAKIQHGESGTDKHLIANYKEVLRKSPLAFECIDGLLSLGVKGTEVNSLIINGELDFVMHTSELIDFFSVFTRILRMDKHIHQRHFGAA